MTPVMPPSLPKITEYLKWQLYLICFAQDIFNVKTEPCDSFYKYLVMLNSIWSHQSMFLIKYN